MNKRIVSSLLTLLLLLSLLTACAPEEKVTERSFDSFTNAIDIGFSQEIMTYLSELGDDPDTGNRSAGSPAEHEAAEYLFDTMEEMGLANVTKDAATVDGWTYRGANLTYKDETGEDSKIVLGGYATNLKAKNEKVQIIYLGRGTAADYEGVDVTGKLVLIDIDQNNEWWINYPAYQAKVKGAKAVIARSIMTGPDENRITSQDICGPADAPVLAISEKDSLTLQSLINASKDKEITVTLNADSAVTPDSTTYNVWGEIPGKTDEVIYLFGHYDGYYHSSFDNASGIATSLGIAKAILDSGIQPDKTIRVVAHGAEEWGRIDSAYDWSCGAYQQIMNIHPEWAEKGFAIINIDGSYPISGETNYGISTSQELQSFIQDSTEELTKAGGYAFSWYAPAGTYTEDFSWTAAGIPSIVAGEGEESIYEGNFYHSTTDSLASAGFDTDTFRFNHELYGQILLDLDAVAVRPMDFTARFSAMEESIDDDIIADDELSDAVKTANKAAKALTKKIKAMNEDYAEAMLASKSEDEEKAAEAAKEAEAIREEAIALNSELFTLYKNTQDALLRLDWALNVVFPHENAQADIGYLTAAIAALENGEIASAYDESLCSIEYAWYATAFDRETYDYFVKQIYDNSDGTFGQGRIEYPACDLYDVMQSLGVKYESTSADTSAEISALQAEQLKQQTYLAQSVAAEKSALAELTAMMEALTAEEK